MSTTMNHLNVQMLDGDNQITHWTGSPSSSGGDLTLTNCTPIGGPPYFDYDTTGNDRKPYTFKVETKILGANKAAQDAFIAKYKQGTVFPSSSISGLPTGLDFVVQSANVKHSDGENPSMLEIGLHEIGQTA